MSAAQSPRSKAPAKVNSLAVSAVTTSPTSTDLVLIRVAMDRSTRPIAYSTTKTVCIARVDGPCRFLIWSYCQTLPLRPGLWSVVIASTSRTPKSISYHGIALYHSERIPRSTSSCAQAGCTCTGPGFLSSRDVAALNRDVLE